MGVNLKKLNLKNPKIGGDTADYIAALAPKGSVLQKLAETEAKLKDRRRARKQNAEYIDAFRSFTSHNGKANDND